MNNLKDKIFDFWFPRGFEIDVKLRAHIKFIIGVCYSMIFVNMVYLILNFIQGIPNTPPMISIISNLILLAVVRFSRSYTLSASCLLLLLSGYIFGLVYLFRSFPYTITLWMPCFAIASVYLLGKKGGAIWTALCALGVFFILSTFEPDSNASFALTPEQIRPILFISISLTMFFAYYASILFMRYISSLSAQLDRQNRELIGKHTALLENINEKRSLIAIICHDIANPLTAIMALSEKAKYKDDIDIYRECIMKITRASDMTKDIIDKVRSFQAVDSGKFSIELAPTNLENVLNNVKLVFSQRLEEKSLKLEFENKQNLSLWVEAEEKSLTYSVLSNLISNAIKFSQPHDKIVISVLEKKGKLCLEIKDFGIGMPPNIVQNLFRQDKKTSRPGTSGEKGTGFGMPITKIFMEKYGGGIEVFTKEKKEDIPDHGTTFQLSFKKSSRSA